MQEVECFKQVTCEQVVVRDLSTAHEQIDKAIAAALHQSKPCYIQIASNLASEPHPSFAKPPTPYALSPLASNAQSLEAAVFAAAEFLNSKQKPVLVAGPELRVAKATDAFLELVDASGYPFAYLSAAKGLLPEDHPSCIGTYWGNVSSPVTREVVESADAYLFAGPVWNDYATVGDTLALSDAKMISVKPYRVTLEGGAQGKVFGCVQMADFLSSLAKKINRNDTAIQIYHRMKMQPAEVPPSPPDSPLLTKVLYKHIHDQLIDPGTVLVAETGDAVFNCQKMELPRGCQYFWSQQYGSIGWSVGATLGLAAAVTGDGSGASDDDIGMFADAASGSGGGAMAEVGGAAAFASEIAEDDRLILDKQNGGTKKRVVACIGDGSFQMTCQELSTMMRYHLNPVIVLINNGSYTIEVEIHDGPYNVLKNWDYVGFTRALDDGQGRAFAVRVKTEEELLAALEDVKHGQGADKLCLIEAIIHRDDCTKELLQWGSLVSRSNSRK